MYSAQEKQAENQQSIQKIQAKIQHLKAKLGQAHSRKRERKAADKEATMAS